MKDNHYVFTTDLPVEHQQVFAKVMAAIEGHKTEAVLDTLIGILVRIALATGNIDTLRIAIDLTIKINTTPVTLQ